MLEFDIYIKNLLNERGINEQDKEDLYYEIKDHLMLLKNEYISKGLSEGESVKLAIKQFGDSNFIGNNIKRNLPSNNKLKDFTYKESAKCLLNTFLIYFVFICLSATVFNVIVRSALFNISLALVVTLTSFIFINNKLNTKRNKIKNILVCNILFFIIEKAFMSIFTILALNIRGGSADSLIITLKNSYIFNPVYNIAFVLLTLGSIIATKYIWDIFFENIRNTYNSTFVSTILFSISILLLFMYYLIPNRFYILRKIIINLMGSDITSVNKNILFIVINKGFVIPNIGLVLLVLLCIRLMIQVRKKGIQSIL